MGSSLFHIIISTPLFRPHQYLDPGSGSFIIQLIIGGLVAVGVGVRMFWGRIRAFFTRNDASASTIAQVPQDTSRDDDTAR